MYNFQWAGSSVVVMFGSHPKGRGFKSRPVHRSLIRKVSIGFVLKNNKMLTNSLINLLAKWN